MELVERTTPTKYPVCGPHVEVSYRPKFKITNYINKQIDKKDGKKTSKYLSCF
jgi:hypothetical protein